MNRTTSKRRSINLITEKYTIIVTLHTKIPYNGLAKFCIKTLALTIAFLFSNYDMGFDMFIEPLPNKGKSWMQL